MIFKVETVTVNMTLIRKNGTVYEFSMTNSPDAPAKSISKNKPKWKILNFTGNEPKTRLEMAKIESSANCILLSTIGIATCGSEWHFSDNLSE